MSDSWKGLLKDLFMLGLLVLIVVIPIRLFIITPFVVDGASMHPTFENLDYLIVDEIIYRFRNPSRGDVVVFRYPANPSIFYIKRIIGLPGETVSINRGVVTVTTTSGEKLRLNEPYIKNEDATYTRNFSLHTDEYFVLGDNRPNSSDSRIWGPLRRRDIIGRVDLRLLPLADLSVFPGTVTYDTATSSTDSDTDAS